MKKKVLTTFLFLVLVFLLFAVSAAAASDFEMLGTSLIKYNGTAENVVIPNNVTSISMDAFAKNTRLKSVTIPAGVKEIDDRAFSGCSNLSTVNFNGGLQRIGSDAFDGCASLKSVVLPSGITEIPYRLFYNCTSLTNVTVPNGVTSIGGYAFAGCSSLVSLVLPDTVNYIGEQVCKDCVSLNSFQFPAQITVTPEYMFSGCISLSRVVFANGTTQIGANTFEDCIGLTSVVIPSTVYSIANGAFSGCASLTSLKIPSSVRSIGSYAFSDCISLSSVSFPSSVQEMGNYLFSGCISLTDVTLASGLTRIGYGMFENCISLGSISMPSSVTLIDAYAFYGCMGLYDIGFSPNITVIDTYAFAGCMSLEHLTMPDSVTSVNSYAFCDCYSLTDIHFSRNLNFLWSSQGVFAGCVSLESITIPATLEDMGMYTFAMCTSLKEIRLENGVSSIGVGCFEGCSSLTTFAPDTVGLQVIGGYAFAGCDNLTNVVIPDGVSEIGEAAFALCPSLQSIVIPPSAIYINSYSFYESPNVVATVYSGSKAEEFCSQNKIKYKVSGNAPAVKSVSAPAAATAGMPFEVTVVTPTSAKYIAQYNDSGVPVARWSDGYTDNGTTRTWKIKVTLTYVGAMKVRIKASADNVAYGSASTASVVVSSPADNAVVSAAFDRNGCTGVPVPITIVTSVNAQKITMFSENGTAAASWTKGYTDVGLLRTWKVEYTFSGAGNRKLSFKAYDGKSEGKGVSAAISVLNAADIAVTNVDFADTIYTYFPTTITVTTTTRAKYISLYSENGAKVGTWNTGYTDASGKRIWKIEYTFTGSGTRTFSFRASEDGSIWGKALSAKSFLIMPDADQIFSAQFESDSTTGVQVPFTVVTTIAANSIRMYAEDGSVVRTWTSGYTDKGVLRTWKLSYTFSGAGNRCLTFKASADNVNYGTGVTAKVMVNKAVEAVRIDSAKFNSSATVGKAVGITVTTPTSVKYIAMCDSTGKTVYKTWNSGYTDSGTTRTWKVSYSFSGAGNRTMYFKASADNSAWSSLVSASVTVNKAVEAAKINSVKFDSSVTVGKAAGITVTTSTTVKYIAMCDSTGKTVYKTWTSGYTDSGTTRTWKVSYSFVGAGNRTMYFKASADNSAWSNLVSASITVNKAVEAAKINTVKFDSSATVGKAAGITVTTPTTAKYIAMCDSTGKTVYKTWNSGYTDSGTTRIWKVSYSFAGAGNRTMYFKASNDNSAWSNLVSAAVTVSKAVVAPKVNSAVFNSDAVVGKNVGITVKTTTATKYVRMCAENGGTVKTWSSGYTDSGDVRTWQLTYSFSGAGYRSITFKASADNSKYDTGIVAKVAVNPAVPVVSGASFNTSSAKVNQSIGITVKTSSNAATLALCAENGAVVKTWSANGNSTVSGNVRTWSVSYAFSGAGARSIGFKASADGSTYGSSVTAKITITK